MIYYAREYRKKMGDLQDYFINLPEVSAIMYNAHDKENKAISGMKSETKWIREKHKLML